MDEKVARRYASKRDVSVRFNVRSTCVMVCPSAVAVLSGRIGMDIGIVFGIGIVVSFKR